MKKFFLLMIPVVVLLIISGCPNTSTQDPIVGTWNLTAATSGGAPVSPAQMGSIVTKIETNGTWSAVVTPPAPGVPTTPSGTWSRSGSTYTIIQTTPTTGTFTGTVSGNTMTVSGLDTNGVPFVQTFTKQ